MSTNVLRPSFFELVEFTTSDLASCMASVLALKAVRGTPLSSCDDLGCEVVADRSERVLFIGLCRVCGRRDVGRSM